MATADYDHPISGMHGRIDRKSTTYHAQRWGKDVTSHYPLKRNKKKITKHQHELNKSFAEVVQQAKIELADPQKRAVWQQRFDEQKTTAEKPYVILRNFVIASLTKQN